MSDPHQRGDVLPATALRVVAATLAGIVVLSGAAMAVHYVPTPDLAHDSVRAFEQDIAAGSSLRTMHLHGSNALVAVLIALVLREAWTADWRGVRFGRWAWGLGALLVVIGFGITGELLPWTQQAVYATTVRVGIAGTAPGGEIARDLALGGEQVSGATLTRFHMLHVFALPLLGAAIWSWNSRLRAHEHSTVPARAGLSGMTALIAGGVLLAVAWLGGSAELGATHVGGDPYEPVPEWHFRWLNALLSLVPPGTEGLVAVGVPGLFAVVLLGWPILDRSGRRRAVWRCLLGAGLLGIAGLTVVGYLSPPENDPRPSYPLSAPPEVRAGYRILRRERCLDCHKLFEFGHEQYDAPPIEEWDREMPVDFLGDVLRDPLDALGTDDMPAFEHLDAIEVRFLSSYLSSIQAPGS